MSRATADAAVGMMDAAYFVGRKELLDFFNDLLDLNLTKIEQTASGAIACQITELIFPGSVPMAKVNWSANSDYEFVSNYKLLQVAFNKHRVQRYVDVDKLIRAKYQDNLEFCQWLKAFYDHSGVYREDYDPISVRAKGKGGKKYNSIMSKKSSASKPPPRPRPRPEDAAPKAKLSQGSPSRHPRPLRERPAANDKPDAIAATPADLRERPAANDKPDATAAATPADLAAASSVVADAQLMKKNADLIAKVADLEQAVVDIEKERDFYFEKLRHVEVLLQIHQEKGDDSDANILVDNVFKILYATAEENLAVDDDGNVVPAGDVVDVGEGELSAEGDLLDAA